MRKPTILMRAYAKAQNRFKGISFRAFVKLSFVIADLQALNSLVVGRVNHIVGEIDEKLCEAALGSGVVAEN